MQKRTGIGTNLYLMAPDNARLKLMAQEEGLTLVELLRVLITRGLKVTGDEGLDEFPKRGAHLEKYRRANLLKLAAKRKAKRPPAGPTQRFVENNQRPKRRHHWLDDVDPGTYAGEMYDNLHPQPKGRGPV